MLLGSTIGFTIFHREQKITGLEELVNDKEDQITSLQKQLSVARSAQNDLNALKQKSSDEAKDRTDLESHVEDLQSQVQKLKDKNNVSDIVAWLCGSYYPLFII